MYLFYYDKCKHYFRICRKISEIHYGQNYSHDTNTMSKKYDNNYGRRYNI